MDGWMDGWIGTKSALLAIWYSKCQRSFVAVVSIPRFQRRASASTADKREGPTVSGVT